MTAGAYIVPEFPSRSQGKDFKERGEGEGIERRGKDRRGGYGGRVELVFI